MLRNPKIDQLLAGTYFDPETGKNYSVTTKSLVIEPTLAGTEGDLVAALGFGRKLAVVSDKTTHAVMGARIEKALAGRFEVQSVVLEDGIHPDGETVELVQKATVSADAVIAVGSGTINDVCKFASFHDGKPYAVFATAASMNGYTSVNAAITMHGHKLSLPAQAPVGAFFDLKILSESPTRLIRAGLGDSLCRTTAQVDWLMAHLLFGKPYALLPYDLLGDDEAPLFAQAKDLVSGDLGAMARLVNTLVLAGFGTAIIGNSGPASQGEHLISHYLDMFSPSTRRLIYHGEQVGVTTLSMARLQERMLAETPVFRADTRTEADFKTRYGDELGASCWAEFAQKRIDAAKAEALNAKIAKEWDSIRDKLSAVLLPSAHLQSVLTAAGANLTPESIDLSRGFYEKTLNECGEIRNRYTFLDLAADSGRLAGMVPTL